MAPSVQVLYLGDPPSALHWPQTSCKRHTRDAMGSVDSLYTAVEVCDALYWIKDIIEFSVEDGRPGVGRHARGPRADPTAQQQRRRGSFVNPCVFNFCQRSSPPPISELRGSSNLSREQRALHKTQQHLKIYCCLHAFSHDHRKNITLLACACPELTVKAP